MSTPHFRKEALEAYFTAYVADFDDATDLDPVANALLAIVVPPTKRVSRPADPLTKGRRYACLTEGCPHVFKTWGDAQTHMKDECGWRTKKPNQGASYAKARTNFRSRLKKGEETS